MAATGHNELKQYHIRISMHGSHFHSLIYSFIFDTGHLNISFRVVLMALNTDNDPEERRKIYHIE